MGRSAELALLGQLFDRLVTLVGPPGTGKTRLALAAAHARAAEGRVVFVPLAAARHVEDVARLVGGGLEVLPDGASLDAATEAIDRALDRVPTLLVLDNLEQLLVTDAVAVWIGDRLAAVPSLRVWATSRELLRLPGERALEVPPLALPPQMAIRLDDVRVSLVPPEPTELDAILGSEAVRLLVSRAPELATRSNAQALGEIAAMLEGIPLALELAGARLVLMGAAELAERLRAHESRLDLLGHGARGRAERQATLRGAIAWSWALLDTSERELCTALALLRGPFTPELASAIGARLGVPAPLEVLQALREKSLVARAERSQLVLFESVRAFAEERLAPEDGEPDADGRAERILPAVLRTLAARARALHERLGGREARATYAELDPLRDHLVRGLELAERHPRAAGLTDDEKADLALALDAVGQRLGLGQDLLRAFAELVESRTLLPERIALVARALARVYRNRGQPGDAVRCLERVQAELGGRPGSPTELLLLVDIGELLLSQGRFDEAREPIEDALAGAERAGAEVVAQRAEAVLGLCAHGQGRLVDAERHYHAALDRAVRLGAERAEAHALRDLGNLALQRGEHARARAYYEDALARSPGGDLRLEGVVRGNLAILHQEEGRLEEALAELKRAIACLRAVGDRPFLAHLFGYLGAIHHERGQLDAAKDAYGRALDVLREVRDLRLEGIFSAARAAVLAQKGALGHAKNDLMTATRRVEEIGDPALRAVLALHRASVRIAEAQLVEASRQGEASKQALAEAGQVLERTREVTLDSDDARFAARMLRRLLPADALVVGPGGAYFVLRGERTSLAGRPTLARLVEALVDARKEGRALGTSELFAAGWPGERALPAAAQNRVRVALTALRNLGLRSAIVTTPEGHVLDPGLPIERTD